MYITTMNRRLNLITLSSFIILLSSSVSIIYWVLFYSDSGVDFTDEGFYLNWISNPNSYSSSLSQFGFFYHPIFSLVDSNIAYLRKVNLVICFLLAFAFTVLLLKKLAQDKIENKLEMLSVGLALATSVFNIVITDGEWLNSASYNTLNLQALLVVAIGFILTNEKKPIVYNLGLLILALGCTVTFLAKPTTAALLYLLVFTLFLLSGQFKKIIFMFGYAAFLVSFFAISIDGSLIEFIKRYQRGYSQTIITDSGHTPGELFRIDLILLDSKTSVYILLLYVFLLILILSLIKYRKFFAYLLLFLCVFTVIVINLLFGDMYKFNLSNTKTIYQEILILGLLIVTITVFITGKSLSKKKVNRQFLSLLILLLFSPYLYSFGSNSNYMYMSFSALFFWIIAASALIFLSISKRQNWEVLIPISVAVQIFTSLQLFTGIENPYRQPNSLFKNELKAPLGIFLPGIKIPESYQIYFQQVSDTVKTSNYKFGTPVIDMTGFSPLTLFSIRAEVLGSAWLIGGYAGSNEFALETLLSIDCEKLSKSWLLVEPEGPRSINEAVLSELGLSFPENYRLQGRWLTPENSSGNKSSRTQLFYSPVNSTIGLTECQISRKFN
jgi:hypothetical protein